MNELAINQLKVYLETSPGTNGEISVQENKKETRFPFMKTSFCFFTTKPFLSVIKKELEYVAEMNDCVLQLDILEPTPMSFSMSSYYTCFAEFLEPSYENTSCRLDRTNCPGCPWHYHEKGSFPCHSIT